MHVDSIRGASFCAQPKDENQMSKCKACPERSRLCVPAIASSESRIVDGNVLQSPFGNVQLLSRADLSLVDTEGWTRIAGCLSPRLLVRAGRLSRWIKGNEKS